MWQTMHCGPSCNMRGRLQAWDCNTNISLVTSYLNVGKLFASQLGITRLLICLWCQYNVLAGGASESIVISSL